MDKTTLKQDEPPRVGPHQGQAQHETFPQAPGRDSGAKQQMIERVLADRQQRERRRRIRILAMRFLLVAAILAVWEAVSGRLIDDLFTSRPTEVVAAMVEGVTEQRLLWHAQITVTEAVSGYLIGAFVAVSAAVVTARFQRLYEVVQPLVMAVYSVPRIALAPLFIIWLGIGITSKIVIAAFMVFFVVFMNTIAGFQAANQKLVQISMLMGASRNDVLRRVLLPSALPYIMTALRIVVPIAMIGAIVGEFISAQRGLGFYISRATLSFNIAGAFAAIFLLMAIVMAMNAIVGFFDRRLLKWREGESGTAATTA